MDKGHYESYFLRANHPATSEAFWIRYTIFSPKNAMDKAMGELWAIYFNGESQEVIACKKELPFNQCTFSDQSLNVKIGDATLETGHAQASMESGKNTLSWNLDYSPEPDKNPTLLFLPKSLYRAKLPKAKAIVGCPNAIFNGSFTVNDKVINIDNWVGSENHNWGSKHTDQYAWGQVAGFDNEPDAFLECITARIKIGPVMSPRLTIAVLRLEGIEYRFNDILKAFKAKGDYHFFDWSFKTSNGSESLNVRIQAPKNNFVGLTYNNPPGGTHTCLNTKIASCTAILTFKNGATRTLTTNSRAAFEILTDSSDHNVPIVA